MLEELKNDKKRYSRLDAVKEHIDNTIDYHIGDDIFYRVFPILSPYDVKNGEAGLSEGQIGLLQYFADNNITVNSQPLNSDELKTISYLAPFLKEKMKYHIIEILRYLQITGNLLNIEDKRVVDIQCVKINDKYYDPSNADNLDFYEYRNNPNRAEYFITNVIRVKKCSNILENDLMDTINTKYLFDFLEKHNIEYTIIEKLKATEMKDISIETIMTGNQVVAGGMVNEAEAIYKEQTEYECVSSTQISVAGGMVNEAEAIFEQRD